MVFPPTFEVTEFYVYAEGDRIMQEVENIGPGLTRELRVELPAGDYEGACKPGMIGDGIRTAISVTGEAAESLSDQQDLKAAEQSYQRYVQTQSRSLVDLSQQFVDAVKSCKTATPSSSRPSTNGSPRSRSCSRRSEPTTATRTTTT